MLSKAAQLKIPLAVIFCYLIVICILILWIFSKTEGHFIYAQDDAYIHMAVAKNFVLHGAWSVYPEGFTFSTSSLLWPLLLSISYFIFGPFVLAPFIWNVLCSIAIIFLVDSILKKKEYPSLYRFLILLLIVFSTPFPFLTMIGMEHLLHVLTNLIFIYAASQIILKNSISKKDIFFLSLLAMILGSTRYEGLFTVFVVGILLFIETRSILSPLIIMVSGWVPATIFGIISLNHGWYFFPNSVLLRKESYPNVILITATLMVLFLCFYFYNKLKSSLSKISLFFLIVFIGSSLLHMAFAKFGWFYRYEPYLIALCTVTIFLILPEIFTQKIHILVKSICVIFFTAVFLFLVYRSGSSLIRIATASMNNYQQQFQMAQFVHKFYNDPKTTGAFNDIGAVAYYNDVWFLDLASLSNIEVMKAENSGIVNSAFMESIAKKDHVTYVFIYDKWYQGTRSPPSTWIKVGMWKIPHNIVGADDTVSIYATSAETKDSLIGNLRSFAPLLPKEVEQIGEYTKP